MVERVYILEIESEGVKRYVAARSLAVEKIK
jgi:hypothetical protein